MAIGAVPFLLPLMMQAGFGFGAVHAGLFVVALFAGDITMKSMVERILRRFGHRPVLIVNGLLCAASLLSLAAIGPTSPAPLVAALLFVNGLGRSLQFSTLSTLAFADVDQAAMGDANGLFNTILQLGAAAGVTAAAMSVHAGEALARAVGLAGLPLRASWPPSLSSPGGPVAGRRDQRAETAARSRADVDGGLIGLAS
jgi:Na+/melibiose symporter-like transporter